MFYSFGDRFGVVLGAILDSKIDPTKTPTLGKIHLVFDIAIFLQFAIKSPIDLRPHTRIITRFEKKIQATLLRAWSEDPDFGKSS